MLRLGALLGLALAIVLFAPGASSASVEPSQYLGDWSADTSSQAPAAEQLFSVYAADEGSARADSGTNSANFDVYCKSTNPGVAPATYFSVTTSGSGTFGGCVSGKTGGHIYTWNAGQVWYAHTTTVDGELLLKGDLVTSDQAHHAFDAHHPEVTFLAHVKYTRILKKATHVADLTTITGGGSARAVSIPTLCSDTSPSLASAFGSLAVKIVKIGGPHLVELDSLRVKPLTDQSGADATFDCDRRYALEHMAVAVTKSDPAEADKCPVHSPGFLSLVDESGRDELRLEIRKCDIDLDLRQHKAPKGSRVAVAETFDSKGY